MAIPQTSVPVEVKRIKDETERGTGLALRWSTGEDVVLKSENLRKHCPCAECLTKRGDTSHDKPLLGRQSLLRVVEATMAESVDLKTVWPVGNYALGMVWGDKHDTGIYSYEFLRSLSNEILI